MCWVVGWLARVMGDGLGVGVLGCRCVGSGVGLGDWLLWVLGCCVLRGGSITSIHKKSKKQKKHTKIQKDSKLIQMEK